MAAPKVREYNDLLAAAEELFHDAERSNLIRYWQLGEIVVEFTNNLKRNKYKDKTIQTLAEDLQNRGVMSQVKEAARQLYWAKSVCSTYTREQLEAMARVGFTVYHAKILLSLEEEQRVTIEAKMLGRNGRVISGRELEQLIRTELKNEAKAALASIKTQEEEDEEAVAEAPVADKSGASTTAPAAVDTDLSDPDVAGSPAQEPADEPALPPEPNPDAPVMPARASRTGAPPREMPASPLRTLASIEKMSDKIIVEAPDALIVVRRVAQAGFDSDRAQQTYNEKLASMKSSLIDMRQVVDELIEVINESNPT